MEERYAKTLTLRFRLPNVMAKSVEPNQPGIICVALPGFGEYPELVLLVDEPENTGASLTNSIELALKYLHDFWGPRGGWLGGLVWRGSDATLAQNSASL